MSEKAEFWDKINLIGRALSFSESNLIQMKRRGYVPPKHHASILDKSKSLGVSLEYSELIKRYN